MTRGFIFVIGVGEQQLYMFSSKKNCIIKETLTIHTRIKNQH